MPVTSLSTGATCGGAVTQMVSRGISDFHLTSASQITYWRLKHSTHTNFATEPIQQSFSNTVQFGGPTATVVLNRTGDMIHRQYIVVDLPGLYPVQEEGYQTPYAYVLSGTLDSDVNYMPEDEEQAGLTNPLGGYYAHWVNAVGFALLKTVRLIVGGHVIDTLYADYMYMYDELCGKPGKRLQDMIGKYESREQLIAYSRYPQRLYVPLPFWYTQVAGNALALVSMAFHGVSLAVDFQALEKLLIVSNRDVRIYKSNEDGTSTGTAVLASDLSACVQTEYVYLDVTERNHFAEGLFDQLIHQVQPYTVSHSQGAVAQLTLMFNHPVIELIFACRLKVNEQANRQFDYSRVGPSEGGYGTHQHDTDPLYSTKQVLQPQTEGTFDILVSPMNEDQTADNGANDLIHEAGRYGLAEVVTVNADPIIEVGLRVNNLQRFNNMEGKYFRSVQPYQHHSCIPKGFIYNYCFALHPDEPNPSGSLNFSRLDSCILELTLHETLVAVDVTFIVYARNWNVFSYIDGIGGSKFHS